MEEMKCDQRAIEQYFPVMWFMILNKVVQTFESVNYILNSDHSHDRLLSSASLWCCLLCCARWF